MGKTELNSMYSTLPLVRRNVFSFLLALLTLMIVFFMIFLNQIVISIRLNELKSYLQDTDQNEGGIDHIALIATYETQKKIYEERISQDAADIIGFKIDSLSLPEKAVEKSSIDFREILAFPAVFIININRMVLGKPRVVYKIYSDREFEDLDRAYYYEKNLLFKNAIISYDKSLEKKNLNPGLRSSIILRQGYCYALAGYNEKAMKNYHTVLTEYSQESSAITASILVRYLEGFTIARERVLHDSDSIMKSQKLVNLLAYRQALDIIEAIESKTDSKDIPRIQYFKGRCFSGLGQPDKAAEHYLKVVTSAPDSVYAKYSNRKLFQIGASAGGDNKILETAKMLNKRLNDPVLDKMIKENGESISLPSALTDVIIINLPVKLLDQVEKMTAEKTPVKDVSIVIITNDGITYKGKLLKKNDDIISLQTAYGTVNIKRKAIKNIYF